MGASSESFVVGIRELERLVVIIERQVNRIWKILLIRIVMKSEDKNLGNLSEWGQRLNRRSGDKLQAGTFYR